MNIRQRLLEILPGTLVWATFVVPIALAWKYPFAIAVGMLIFAVYWLIKVLVISYHLVSGYIRYRQAIERGWRKDLEALTPKGAWEKIWHVAIIPTYKEELPTLRHTFKALAESDYPLKHHIVVLATEERDLERARKNARAIKKEFGKYFGHFQVTEHPGDIPGEVRGKGPNITWAGRKVARLVRKLSIDPENVIVTTLDADNRVHRQYFASLTFAYLTSEDPTRKSYQPLSMYFNNIWHVPAPIRLVSLGSSFWQMVESTRPHRMRNFSAHAQSLKTLLATRFWSVRSIVEDGHQFWRTYFAYEGHHQVVPIYVPVYQDAVFSPRGYRATFREQYLQRRRWYWGVSDIPYVFEHLLRLQRKLGHVYFPGWIQFLRLLEGQWSLATNSIILAAYSWLPIVASRAFRETLFAHNLPIAYSRILTLAMIGLVVSLVISTLLLPPRPVTQRFPKFRFFIDLVLTPLLLPITNILFGSIPAIEAQTRLMFGRYMTTFHVVEKRAPIH
jgi:hypothetical protein